MDLTTRRQWSLRAVSVTTEQKPYSTELSASFSSQAEGFCGQWEGGCEQSLREGKRREAEFKLQKPDNISRLKGKCSERK